MTQTGQQPPEFNPGQMLELYQSGRHDELAGQFIRVLAFFQANTLKTLDKTGRDFVDSFMNVFLSVFSRPDYKMDERFTVPFICLNRTISNLVAMSSFRTTDAQLEIIRGQSGNFARLLTLYSARNMVRLDCGTLFGMSPKLASLWYYQYASVYHGGLASPVVWGNLREHFAFKHPGLHIEAGAHEIYYGSTYVDGKCDRLIKAHINEDIRRHDSWRPPQTARRPNPLKIAVISGTWQAAHSAYRTGYHYLRALKPKYHLTFFSLGENANNETSLFDETRVISLAGGTPDFSSLDGNDFQVVIYPEVGMASETIALANRRLAPIQTCLMGHSVSTYGSEIDYFFSGADVETPDSPERDYSERLVLLPGMGLIHNEPQYKPKGAMRGQGSGEGIVINCPWTAQKVNYPFLLTLGRLLERVRKKITFRLFVMNTCSRSNDHLPFVSELKSRLRGGIVEVLAELDYQRYMSMMEEGDLTLDSYHFGGCNTVSDSLFLRLPTVAWEGDKWYNRIGPRMLELVGMRECVATDEEEYLSIAQRVIEDDAYRKDVRERLEKADLKGTIYGVNDARHFATAVDYLVENHGKLRQDAIKTPIRIQG